MDIHSLTYFKKVAELQHITQAAKELHVVQPSLSRTIAGLERELGVQLFERVGRSIALNRYGEIVLRHTNQIMQELRDIEVELADARDDFRRTVTISLYAASKILPQMIIDFKREYPSIRLQIIQEDLTSSLDECCDLSIFSSIQPCHGENEITLIEEEILLALPESNPLASQQAINLKDVEKEGFIGLYRGKSLRTITDIYCQMAGFEPNVVLESDSPETVRELIHAGIGIAFIPSITWQGMETDNVVLLPISFPQCKRYINLSWRENGYLSPAAVLFRDFVRRYFSDL